MIGEISEKLTFRLLEVEEKLSQLEKVQRESSLIPKKLAVEALQITDHKLAGTNSKLDQISRKDCAVKNNHVEAVTSTNLGNSTANIHSYNNYENRSSEDDSIIETQYIDDPQIPMT